MEWNVVKISQTSGNNVPFVSIGRGQLDFNAVACDLINDCGNYRFVQLLTGKENGNTVVAVKFLKEALSLVLLLWLSFYLSLPYQ